MVSGGALRYVKSEILRGGLGARIDERAPEKTPPRRLPEPGLLHFLYHTGQ